MGEAIWLLVDTTQELVDVIWSSVTSLVSSMWLVAKSAGWRVLAALRGAVSPLLRGIGTGGGWVISQVSDAVALVFNAFNELVDQLKGTLLWFCGFD